MRTVRMRVFANGLNPGDLCGYDDEIAARMIARGEAVAVEPTPKPLPVMTAEQKIVVEKAAPEAERGSFKRFRR